MRQKEDVMPETELQRWWATADEIAASMRPYIRDGATASALRLLMDGINYLPDAAAHGDLDMVLVPPSSTGDERWDTLLAAAIRLRLHSIGAPAPTWTHKPPLPRMWWPRAHTRAKAINDFNRAPAELRRVGIFLDESGFKRG